MTTSVIIATPLKRIVPWKYRKEWMDVYLSAFSNNREKQEYAVKRLVIWKIRSCENLSLSIELTWQLLSLKLKDAKNEENKFLDDINMRSLYGIYIIRFVNYTLEACQNGKTLISLKHLATKVGLPQWILNLRHTLTYEALPEIGLLREAVDQALTFLKENYWDLQAQHTICNETECRERTNSLLDEYFQLMKQLKNKRVLSDIKSKLQELELHVQANCETFLKTISEHDSLIFPPSNTGGDILQIPKDITRMWGCLFDQLNEWNLMPAYLERLLRRLTDEASDWNRCILAWTCFACRDEKQSKQGKFNVETNKILLLAMENPNKFTPFFVDKFCGMFPEMFKHRVELLSLLTVCGIDHPWQGHCLEFKTLEERGQRRINQKRCYDFDPSSSIVKIERVNWNKTLQNVENIEQQQQFFPSFESNKLSRQDMEIIESEVQKKQPGHHWKFRNHSNHPIASELTWQLLYLEEIDLRNKKVLFLTDYEMRSLYGMHMIRFIEKTLQCHKRGKTSSSLESVAKKVGLPQWMVDLRHEAAHQSPPELFILRDAVNLALNFLKIDYWIPQSLYNAPDDIEDVTSLYDFFKLVKHSKDTQNSTELNYKPEDLQLHFQSNCKALIESLINKESLTFLPNDSGDHTEILKPTEDALKEWLPIFDQLIEWNLMNGFLEHLLKKLTEKGTEQDHSILSWTCFICNKEGQKKQQIASYTNFDAKKILYKGTIKPNKFTSFFVNTICSLFSEVFKYRSDLLSLLNACGYDHSWQGGCVSFDTSIENIGMKTNQDFEAQAHEKMGVICYQPIIEKILTDVKDEIEWWCYPLGVNPSGYFGATLKTDHELNKMIFNEDASMEFTAEELEL